MGESTTALTDQQLWCRKPGTHTLANPRIVTVLQHYVSNKGRSGVDRVMQSILGAFRDLTWCSGCVSI
jgi:hypothetical protein